MKGFISYGERLQELLPAIVQTNTLHAKWLNTLSYLENCGARKIAACEHPTEVQEEMLKHASEEFRHAHYLKRQIEKVSHVSLEDYSLKNILGGVASLQYLNVLDLQTCRFLSKEAKLSKERVREYAYILVTYAIELRADELYKFYDEVLRHARSQVTVRSILFEEKEHLQEMRQQIEGLKCGGRYAALVCELEGRLCGRWLGSLEPYFV